MGTRVFRILDKTYIFDLRVLINLLLQVPKNSGLHYLVCYYGALLCRF